MKNKNSIPTPTDPAFGGGYAGLKGVYGDFDGNLTGKMMAAGQTLSGPTQPFDGVIYGDVTGSLFGRSSGGNDTISGQARAIIVYGDAGKAIGDHARGGDDTITVGGSSGSIYGDAQSMLGQARGGNDVITAKFGFGGVFVYGDAGTMTDRSVGGDDVILLNAERGSAYGDAKEMSGSAVGGNDTITSMPPANAQPGMEVFLYGDAQTMSGRARGGNDTLVSGAGADQMWGDAAVMLDAARGGADTFVFAGNFGSDRVYDYRPGEGDRLQIDVADPSNPYGEIHWETSGTDVIIHVSGPSSTGDIVLVNSTHAFSVSDLLLV
ncbi:hypothetical protein [Salinarimonas soli]|uniref:Calcium-binding protein n=1 Tax=Salinarimonas soli TaxID=1638099 RepID=A0A5B2VHH1_9HYPH|nr:hypothetical protein [Salinarimonas soli]KAA2237986.1 hypothetical protein F0L46_06865 [Salinarimonas soli]